MRLKIKEKISPGERWRKKHAERWLNQAKLDFKREPALLRAAELVEPLKKFKVGTNERAAYETITSRVALGLISLERLREGKQLTVDSLAKRFSALGGLASYPGFVGGHKRKMLKKDYEDLKKDTPGFIRETLEMAQERMHEFRQTGRIASWPPVDKMGTGLHEGKAVSMEEIRAAHEAAEDAKKKRKSA